MKRGRSTVAQPTSPPEFDAVRTAREVVGLYGDPAVTWGISLESDFATPLDQQQVEARMAALVEAFPHLGVAPVVERVAASAWAERREAVGSAPLGHDGRLVHVMLDDAGTRLFVTAHHGACDGLGLVALTAAAAGVPIVSSARGVGETPAPRPFLVSSVLRLGEAILAPPARFSGDALGTQEGGTDLMRHAVLDGVALNSARVCHALLDAHSAWPRRRSSGGRRFMVIMGASRRRGAHLAPDRSTTFLRIRLRHGDSLEAVRNAIRATEPEPDFPETSAKGIGPLVTRLLRNRLGYTVNVSNLGRLSGEGLLWCTIFPATSGPMAVGVGVVTVGDRVSVSVRMRSSEHTPAEPERLIGALAAHLTDSSSRGPCA